MSTPPTANHSAEQRHKSTTATQPPVANGQTTIPKAPPTRLSIVNTFTLKKERVGLKKQYKSAPHVIHNYCARCQFRFVLDWCEDCESCLRFYYCFTYVPLLQSLSRPYDAEEPPSYGL